MIFRLEYCNRDELQARLDITTPGEDLIVEIEGTGDPFRLTYKSDKQDKSFHFQTTSAEINIYETDEFNIDILKTSNETQIKVDYYIDGQKNWEGFVIPDFFSREIGGAGVVSMVASDRISTLKGVTLSDLPAVISIRDLAVQCLAKTGLDLTLKTMADFESDSEFGFNEYFRSNITSQRLYDTRGRSISCYDILHSILVASGSKLVQKDAEWHIINKLQHEAGVGRVYSAENTSSPYVESVHDFSDIRKGAIRTIVPVAGSVGIYHEYGGGKLHPDNYDFSQELAGWDRVGGFNASISSRSVNGYVIEGGVYVPDYGEETGKNHLMNSNPYQRNINPIYLESAPISVPYSGSGAVKIDFEINGVGPMVMPRAIMRIAIVAQKGSEVLTLHHGGSFAPMPSSNPPVFEKPFTAGFTTVDFTAGADTQAMRVSGTLESSDLEGWNLRIRIYGSGTSNTVLINAVSLVMSSSQEVPKGAIYKREQGSDFTRAHDIDTVIFGDYLTGGLDGYFYDYPIDDTSSIHNLYTGISSLWTTPYFPTETDALPLLQHVVRQKARMFSVAHDMVSGEIDMEVFDPLSVFVDCNGKRYVVVSAEFDFLRSIARVDLEEIAYENLMVRDFIYSYFGEGESGISSIGGISSGTGGGGGGGGMTPEQLAILNNLASWWKLDEENDAIYSEKSVYSLKGVSALGLGSGGGGGGGDFDRLDDWEDYTEPKAGWVLSALLGYDLHTRVNDLEDSNIDIVVTGAGNAVTDVSKSGNTLTFAKGSTFSLSTHNHDTLYKPIDYAPSWVEVTGKPTTFAPSAHTHTIANVTGLQTSLNGKEPSFTKNTAFNKNFGTTSGTVAQGNDSRINNGQTAFNWGNHAGLYPTLSVFNNHVNNNVANQKHLSDAQLAYLNNLIGWWKLDEDGNLYTEKNLYSTKGVSALGLGDGGGGGGDFDRLDAWVDYDSTKSGWVLSALLGVDLNNRLSNVEGGSATSVSVTGTGDVIVGGSKSGNVITLTRGNQSWDNLSGKPATFTPASHTHSTSDITSGIFNIARIPTGTSGTTVALGNHLHTGVYEPVFAKNTAFNKNFGTTSGTVAQGNDSRINNGQAAFNWGNHASAGYALNTALTAHTGNSTVHITSTERTNWNDANSKKHTHSNKALLDLITQSNIDVLEKLSVDGDGNIKVDTTLWATGGISALGLGDDGGSGGVDMLDSWANYTTAKANYYVPASLLVPFRNDTLSRLTSLESGSATSITTTGSGNAITSLTKSGSVITANKGLNFSQVGHIHAAADITSGILATARLGSGTPSSGNFLRGDGAWAVPANTTYAGSTSIILSGTSFQRAALTGDVTSAQNNNIVAFTPRASSWINDADGLPRLYFGGAIATNAFIVRASSETTQYFQFRDINNTEIWSVDTTGLLIAGTVPWARLTNMPTTLSGYGITDAYTKAEVNSISDTITTALNTHISNGTANAKHLTDAQLAYLNNLIGWWKVDASGNLYTEKNLYSTKGVSALGVGDDGGSGGGGVDMLDAWANYTEVKADYYVPASLLVPFRNDTLSRLTSLESGSATSIVTTGSGNAITSISKTGTVITATKGLTFALASHTHTIAQITGLQGALDLKATQSDIDTAIDGIGIGGRNLLLNSNFKTTSFNGWSALYGTQQITENGYLKTYTEVQTAARIEKAFPFNGVGTFTFSVKVKTDVGIDWRGWVGLTMLNIKIEQIEDDFEIHSIAFSNSIAGDKVIRGYQADAPIGTTTLIEWEQLEKGTIATDWTPAPEDQVSDWSETNEASFSYIKNKPTQLSQFTDNIGVATHIANTSNPHNVTKAQVGLSNVDNTSDLLKPISNAVQTALNLKAPLANPTFTGNVTAPVFVGALSGNASTATTLETARTIWGQSFDGTGNVTGSMSTVSQIANGEVYIRHTSGSHTILSAENGSIFLRPKGDTDSVGQCVIDNIGNLGVSGSITAPTFIGALTGNADTATKLQTAITIAGVSFDGTADIAIPFANLASKPTTLGEYGITDAVTLNTTQTITGAKTFSTLLTASAGVNTPKVDFGNGFTIEPSGTELVFKYNDVIKQRMLSDGTILAVGGITALSTE